MFSLLWPRFNPWQKRLRWPSREKNRVCPFQGYKIKTIILIRKRTEYKWANDLTQGKLQLKLEKEPLNKFKETCVLSHAVVHNSATPWTATHQAALPWAFSGENMRVGCHFLLGLPDPGIEPISPMSPALQADFLPTKPPGNHRGRKK